MKNLNLKVLYDFSKKSKKVIWSFLLIFSFSLWGQNNTIYDLTLPSSTSDEYEELDALRTLNLYPNGSSGYDLTGNDYRVLVDERGAYPDSFSFLNDFLNNNQGYRFGSYKFNLVCNEKLLDISSCFDETGVTSCELCNECNDVSLQCGDEGANTLWDQIVSNTHSTTSTRNCGGCSDSGQIFGAAPLVNMYNNRNEFSTDVMPSECSENFTSEF